MGSFKLQKNIDKYLKYMEFIKSASPLTLRHYLLDLQQAFGIAQNMNKNQFPQSCSVEQLLPTARAAFSGPWKGLSLASRNRKAATLKSFFGWAYREGLLEKDIATQIISPKVPKRLPHFLSVDEILAVLQNLSEKDHKGLQQKALFLLLYGGGLRVSEACSVRWKDLQFAQRSLRVLGKGKKERIVILPKTCLATLQKLHATESGDYVFGNKPLHTRTAYEIIRQQGIQAGLIQPLHPHALRHSFATHLLSSGANLRTLQEMLGHESLQATEKYTHLGIDQLARTMESLHPLGRGKKSS